MKVLFLIITSRNAFQTRPNEEIKFKIIYFIVLSLINLYDRQIMVFSRSVIFSLFQLHSRTFWYFISCQKSKSFSYLQFVTINTNFKGSRIISAARDKTEIAIPIWIIGCECMRPNELIEARVTMRSWRLHFIETKTLFFSEVGWIR